MYSELSSASFENHRDLVQDAEYVADDDPAPLLAPMPVAEETGKRPRSVPRDETHLSKIVTSPLFAGTGPGESSMSLVPSSVWREEGNHSSTSAGRGDHGTSAYAPKPRQVLAPMNAHELRVLPDEHSVIDDDLLRCTPYIVNDEYMVLICTDCRHGVNHDRASEHLRKHHPHCKVRTDFVSQLNARFPELESEMIHPLEVVDPIFGLAIPLEQYIVCARCHRGYVNIPTWSRHVCRNAAVDLEGGREYFTSLVQTFFRGPKVGYFPIQLPISAASESHGDDFKLFMSTFQDPSVSEDKIREPEDYRELNQFLLKEGWIRHLSGYSRPEISKLTELPREDEVLRPVMRDVVALMSNIQDAIGRAGYYVRRLLGRRPA